MLRPPICLKCKNPLLTRSGTSGLCRSCSTRRNFSKRKGVKTQIEWTEEELATAKLILAYYQRIEDLKQSLMQTHTFQGVRGKLACLERAYKS